MGKNSAYILILSVLVLVSIGLVILTSVSAFAPANNGNPDYFVIRQSIFLGLAIVLCVVAAKWDYHHWIKYAWLLLGAGLVLMAACFLPVIGVKVNGAHRWVNVGFTRMQPVELAKFGLIMSMAWWFGLKAKNASGFRDGVIIPLALYGATAMACVAQSDLGTTSLLMVISLLLMFIAGTKFRYVSSIFMIGFFGIIGIALTMPQRVARLMAFMDPEAHKGDTGLQVWNALVAFGSGGISGRGLGEGVQKMRYLPEAHTDFIFPNIGEELGLIFTLLVVFFFLLLVLSGGVISFHAPDHTGLLIGIGATSLIGLQGMMNMAVVTSLMPTKGIGLPFISYGGSNLLLCFLLIGILLNIHFQAVYGKKKSRPANMPAAMTARM